MNLRRIHIALGVIIGVHTTPTWTHLLWKPVLLLPRSTAFIGLLAFVRFMTSLFTLNNAARCCRLCVADLGTILRGLLAASVACSCWSACFSASLDFRSLSSASVTRKSTACLQSPARVWYEIAADCQHTTVAHTDTHMQQVPS